MTHHWCLKELVTLVEKLVLFPIQALYDKRNLSVFKEHETATGHDRITAN